MQSAATPSLVRALESGAADTVTQDAGETLAYGLNVPGGVGHFRVLEIIRESGGAAVAVSEEDIAAEVAHRWSKHHDWIGPEGAACLAALPQLVDRDLITQGDNVVVVNTGSLEKYLPAVRHLL